MRVVEGVVNQIVTAVESGERKPSCRWTPDQSGARTAMTHQVTPAAETRALEQHGDLKFMSEPSQALAYKPPTAE